MAHTETVTYQDSLDSQYLSNSFSNLSRSRSTNSLIVRTYKQAAQLYLTKRFKDALEILEPIISPQQPLRSEHDSNGVTNGEEADPSSAPVTQASKTTRTKIWVFYLSLLNAIIELGPEEGKLIFGSTTWRQLAAKAREGTVWDEIVSRGYGGNEGELDAEVVVNLATLLIGHMQDQKLNQQRLETYLSTSDTGADNGRHVAFAPQDGTSTPGSVAPSSPKALAARLKILELYTLHVLPANNEWQYARQFIEMNDALDEERREAFLNALQSLQEEKDGTAQRERELEAQRQKEMDEQRKQQEEEEARRIEEARKEAERRQREAEVERQRPSSSGSATSSKATNGSAKPTPNGHKTPTTTNGRPSSKPQRKPPGSASTSPSLYNRASSVVNNLQQMVLHASRSMTGSSMALLRLVMFMMAFLLIIARRDLRLKIKRTLNGGFTKVKQTVGMGVKVSYI